MFIVEFGTIIPTHQGFEGHAEHAFASLILSLLGVSYVLNTDTCRVRPSGTPFFFDSVRSRHPRPGPGDKVTFFFSDRFPDKN